MYIVFKCKKCYHELYMDAYNIGWKNFKKLSERECPSCGEEGYENWILKGVCRETPDVLAREEED